MPDDGESSRPRIESSVDLPQPDGPAIATYSPFWISRWMPRQGVRLDLVRGEDLGEARQLDQRRGAFAHAHSFFIRDEVTGSVDFFEAVDDDHRGVVRERSAREGPGQRQGAVGRDRRRAARAELAQAVEQARLAQLFPASAAGASRTPSVKSTRRSPRLESAAALLVRGAGHDAQHGAGAGESAGTLRRRVSSSGDGWPAFA